MGERRTQKMKQKVFTADSGSAASKFGQMIGEHFERAVIALIKDYVDSNYNDYELLEPEQGKQLVTLEMLGGSARQLDTVLSAKESAEPVALLETKWLKDARHHNDKGAWILQLREVKKKHPTIRGAVAVLAGYWTEGVGVALMSEGGIKMVLTATDAEIYSTLQGPLDNFLGDDSFTLDPATMRKRYIRPAELANFIIHLDATGQLESVAQSWLNFLREIDNKQATGGELIKKAIDELLTPFSFTPNVQRFKVSLDIDTGNVIYQEFDNLEDAMDFVTTYAQNPDKILDKITPRALRK